MVVVSKLASVLMVVLALLLAGCTADPTGEEGTGNDPGDAAPEVEATETTGGIRGVIVDDRIVPIEGALVEVMGLNKSVTTQEDGAFVFNGLEPGTYTVRASHGLYASAQQTTEVVAGDSDPPAVKIQLVRTVFANPYIQTFSYEGYIVCSVNTIGLLSEECGEGVGVDGVGRVGGQSNNNVQFDVAIDSASIKSIVFEKYWEATSEAGNELYTPIGLDWVCNPTCDWTAIKMPDGSNLEMNGPSPQYAQIFNDTIEDVIVPDEILTMFTWAGSFEDPAGVAINQGYRDYMTISYYLPLPEGWSFVNGDADPFA